MKESFIRKGLESKLESYLDLEIMSNRNTRKPICSIIAELAI